MCVCVREGERERERERECNSVNVRASVRKNYPCKRIKAKFG